MSTTINIDVDASRAIALLSRTRGTIAAATDVHRQAATAVAGELLRPWFITRNTRRSRHATSNYWSHAAEAISTTATPEAATITIRHPGIRWHRYGGTINAKPGKALAIPLRDSVYGVWPSEIFPNKGDAFVWRKHNKAFLATRSEDGKSLRILYILLKSVSKDPDPSVLPSDQEIATTATNAIREFIIRTMKGATA